jgi:hypothetical protein
MAFFGFIASFGPACIKQRYVTQLRIQKPKLTPPSRLPSERLSLRVWLAHKPL